MSESDPIGNQGGITRRELIGAVGAAAALAGAGQTVATAVADTPARIAALLSTDAATYPPLRTGMRGQHPGSFEALHAVRDGAMHGPLAAASTGEHYDLVVVGAGLSGLAAAYLYRKALGPGKKILLLDNLDDVGGHAKRNEFHLDGRVFLGIGGSMNTHAPFPYSQTTLSLLAELGVNPAVYSRYSRPQALSGLKDSVFFDKETFGADQLVTGFRTQPWKDFFAATPLPARAREELTRLYTQKVDYMPELDPVQRALALQKISYLDYLRKYGKLSEPALKYFAGFAWRNNKRVDSCPAYEIAALFPHEPGFSGMKVDAAQRFDSKVFTFPDGNASVVRLFVSRLIPEFFPGQGPFDMESIILARAEYANLDKPSSPVRIRLSSPVVRVEHIDPRRDIFTEKAVRVVYLRDGSPVEVTAANVILACFNSMIRFIAPECPKEQAEAQAYASKVPLEETNVLVRNWRAWKNLGIKSVHVPSGFYQYVGLALPVEIGGYRSVTHPDEPVVVHMGRNPNHPGENRKEQNRDGRRQMLGETIEDIENESRALLDRILGPGGFDAGRDVAAITVNRWAHGYAYTYDTLNDPGLPDIGDLPHVHGRKPFGRIAIANSDAAASAFMTTAIDQALRAVSDCLISRGLT